MWNQLTHELCNEKVNKNEIPGMGNVITCRLLCGYELLGTSALLLEQKKKINSIANKTDPNFSKNLRELTEFWFFLSSCVPSKQ